jgi:serine/threonine protein kinase
LIGYCEPQTKDESDKYWIILEYHEGGNLKSVIQETERREKLTTNVIIRLASEIAAGVADLHEAKPFPVIHKDLKPQNVLVRIRVFV